MSFLAKLFLDGTERPVQRLNIRLHQAVDDNLKPTSLAGGGFITLTLDGPHKDLFSWMVSADMMKAGMIRFYERDGLSKAADLEFWDSHCIHYKEHFTQFDATPYTTEIIISPGIFRYREASLEKSWKLTDLAAAAASQTSPQTRRQEQAKILSCHMEDEAGNKIERAKKGQTLYLVVKTKEMAGKKVNIDLGDSKIDFEHAGKLLENDLLQDYAVTGDLMKIELKAVKKRS